MGIRTLDQIGRSCARLADDLDVTRIGVGECFTRGWRCISEFVKGIFPVFVYLCRVGYHLQTHTIQRKELKNWHE